MVDNTGPGTLWSRTLIDLLMTAVARRDANEIARLLRTLKSRGVRKHEVLRSARERLTRGQMSLLEQMIKGMGRGRAVDVTDPNPAR